MRQQWAASLKKCSAMEERMVLARTQYKLEVQAGAKKTAAALAQQKTKYIRTLVAAVAEEQSITSEVQGKLEEAEASLRVHESRQSVPAGPQAIKASCLRNKTRNITSWTDRAREALRPHFASQVSLRGAVSGLLRKFFT